MAKSVLFNVNDTEREKDLRGDFKSSLIIRNRIVEVLQDKIEINRKSLRQKINYADASWPYEQADGVGYERALYEVISLLTEN